MMIAPVIFCTVVHGIASMSNLAKVGRVGLKALIYFEVVSTVALAIGLLVGDIVKPGQGFNIDPSALDPHAVAAYVTRAKEEGVVAHLLAIIPNTFVDAFAKGDLLQVLLIAILTGIAVSRLGELGQRINGAVDAAGKVFFRIIGLIVSSVEPQSWWVNGGTGRIVFDPRTKSLIVSQTAEIHYMLSLGKR